MTYKKKAPRRSYVKLACFKPFCQSQYIDKKGNIFANSVVSNVFTMTKIHK